MLEPCTDCSADAWTFTWTRKCCAYSPRPNEVLAVRQWFKEDLGSVRLSCDCILWTYRKRHLKAGHQIASTIILCVVFWLQTIRICFTINLYDGPFTIALRVMDKGLFEFSASKWVVQVDCKHVETPIRMQLYDRIRICPQYFQSGLRPPNINTLFTIPPRHRPTLYRQRSFG